MSYTIRWHNLEHTLVYVTLWQSLKWEDMLRIPAEIHARAGATPQLRGVLLDISTLRHLPQESGMGKVVAALRANPTTPVHVVIIGASLPVRQVIRGLMRLAGSNQPVYFVPDLPQATLCLNQLLVAPSNS